MVASKVRCVDRGTCPKHPGSPNPTHRRGQALGDQRFDISEHSCQMNNYNEIGRLLKTMLVKLLGTTHMTWETPRLP